MPHSEHKPPKEPADPDRTRAYELYHQGKFVDAMPLFEKLAADHPKDPALREGWAWCMFGFAATVPQPEERKKVRARARAIAVEANRLGDDSQLLKAMLDMPEDGSEGTFSQNSEVNAIMRGAEADFARGDLDKARSGYLHALLLDPTNYPAALFIGDVYYKQRRYDDACDWFSRATQIDANRETAYRYWGDTLVATEKPAEARARFIDAIVAEPYNRSPWEGLTNWLRRNKLELNNVQLKDGAWLSTKDHKNYTITIDTRFPKNDPNMTAWTTYGMGLASWHTEQSQKEFPNVPRDRRTLQEEAHALGLMIAVMKEGEDYQANLKRLEPGLQSLIKIQEAGFLEPFVLLNRADAGIAQDYAAYRANHRDLIRRYLDEFVVAKGPPGK